MMRRSANKNAAQLAAKKTISPVNAASQRISTARQASQEAATGKSGTTTATPQPGSLKGLPWGEFLYICTIFAITGSSAAYFVRPTIKFLLTTSAGSVVADRIGIYDVQAASLSNGPWSFRFLYMTCMTPMYSVLLFTFGTLLGRGYFFRHFLVKMWKRMLPRPLHDRMKYVLLGVEA